MVLAVVLTVLHTPICSYEATELTLLPVLVTGACYNGKRWIHNQVQFKSALSAFHLEILKSTDNTVLPSDICTPTLLREHYTLRIHLM